MSRQCQYLACQRNVLGNEITTFSTRLLLHSMHLSPLCNNTLRLFLYPVLAFAISWSHYVLCISKPRIDAQYILLR
jgi:hypothetical protein